MAVLTMGAPAAVGAKAPVWSPPATAVDEWLALNLELAELGQAPPCAADPGAWFPDKGRRDLVEVAVAGCGRCPLSGSCRAYAVAAGEREGIWGGTTDSERSALRSAA